MQTEAGYSKGYIVAHVTQYGVISWTKYHSKKDFKQKNKQNKLKVVEKDITKAHAKELTRSTPAECHIVQAAMDSVDPKTGKIELKVLEGNALKAKYAITRYI